MFFRVLVICLTTLFCGVPSTHAENLSLSESEVESIFDDAAKTLTVRDTETQLAFMVKYRFTKTTLMWLEGLDIYQSPYAEDDPSGVPLMFIGVSTHHDETPTGDALVGWAFWGKPSKFLPPSWACNEVPETNMTLCARKSELNQDVIPIKLMKGTMHVMQGYLP